MARAMDGILAEAALQWVVGDGPGLALLAQAKAAARPRLAPLPGVLNRGIAEVLTDAEWRRRRARFHAMLLKRAYSLRDWLPPEALLHLRRVDIHPDTGRVLISLWGEARILDTGDRIVLRGELEDVGAAEVAECAVRRGWGRVEVTGTEEFSREVSRELLRRGIEVVGCPLSRDEQAALRREAGGFDWRLIEECQDEGWVPPAPRPPWADQLA